MNKLVLGVCIVLCTIGIGFAADVEFNATKDVYVNESDPGTNYGADYFLAVWGGSEMPPTLDEMILVEFHGLDELAAAGAKIDNAILKLFVTTYLTAGDVLIYRIADEWAEMEVTWFTRPDSNTQITVNGTLPLSVGVWFETNVTDIVRSWVEGGYPNRGFYIVSPVAGPGVQIGAQFSSRENIINNPPKLDVEYHSGGAVEEENSDIGLDVMPLTQGKAEISYCIPGSTRGSLKVYDARGSLIETLLVGSLSAGSNQLIWSAAGSGIYFVRLETVAGNLYSRFVAIK